MKKFFLISASFLPLAAATPLLCAFTCQKRTDSPVIARVGNAVLTVDDLYERIPPEYNDRITREQKVNYVKQWIDTELLYQEALRQKVHGEKEISARLKQMEKDLLSSEMISRNAVEASRYPLSDDSIGSYYEQHKDSFVRESDVIKYLEIIVCDQQTAWDVHRKITKDNFLDLAVKYSKAPVQDPRSISYVPISVLPKKIEEVVSSLKINGTSTPFEIDGAYHIVRIIDKQQCGTPCSFEEVREEIIGMLSTEAQKQYMENLLSSLRLKTDYEFHVDLIPGGESGAVRDTAG